MSSLPGHSMEDYLMWNFNIRVLDRDDANASIRIAEILGTESNRRKVLSEELFKPLVAMFEAHRETIERILDDFNSKTQSWRDYASYAFDSVPPEVYIEGDEYLNKIGAK